MCFKFATHYKTCECFAIWGYTSSAFISFSFIRLGVILRVLNYWIYTLLLTKRRKIIEICDNPVCCHRCCLLHQTRAKWVFPCLCDFNRTSGLSACLYKFVYVSVLLLGNWVTASSSDRLYAKPDLLQHEFLSDISKFIESINFFGQSYGFKMQMGPLHGSDCNPIKNTTYNMSTPISHDYDWGCKWICQCPQSGQVSIPVSRSNFNYTEYLQGFTHLNTMRDYWRFGWTI